MRRQIGKKEKKQVFRRDRGRCIVCGTTKGPFHYDHQVPHTSGGLSTVANEGLLCRKCNLKKAHYRVSWARLKEIMGDANRNAKTKT